MYQEQKGIGFMENLMSSIILGASNFGFFAMIFTIPFLVIQVIRKKFNFVRMGINYAFILYILCLTALVFFPLPTLEEQANLSGHQLQWIPFHFVNDIIRTTPFVLDQPQTYIAALTDQTVLQVVFNVMMTIPFGMYLHYNFHFSCKKVAVFSFGLSLFIELAQLTGLFFIFSGSYRLCDVDDLIANTFGGIIGYAAEKFIEKFFYQIEAYDNFPLVFRIGRFAAKRLK